VKRYFLSVRLAAVVFAGLIAAPEACAGSGEAASSAAVEISPGDYVLPGVIALTDKQNAGQISNCGFIIGRDGVAVIDTSGSPAAGRKLRAAIRALTSKPILYVIFTHGHPDHILGAAAFVEDHPVFVGHRALPAAMAAHSEDYLTAARNLLGEQEFAGTRIVPPTLLVDGEEEIDLGDRRLKIESWPPGHTNTDITITDESSGALFLGDLLFSGHIPALDGKLTGWLENLQKLKQRQVKRVVPGHGPASMAWPEAAEAEEAYLRRLRDDVGQALSQGRTIRQAAEASAATERGKWRLFDDFNPRNATAAYHELEWQ
jgi:quinoprotein relay system zinc metallohydrolase 2